MEHFERRQSRNAVCAVLFEIVIELLASQMFGTHDDQADAISRGFALLVARRPMRTRMRLWPLCDATEIGRPILPSDAATIVRMGSQCKTGGTATV
jgi:hypothetical protein